MHTVEPVKLLKNISLTLTVAQSSNPNQIRQLLKCNDFQ